MCFLNILGFFKSCLDSFFFSYIIEQDVCFLTLCDRSFNKKLAYSFLEDLSQEFYNMYGHKISTASRPYSFIEFDTYIQKAKKKFTDTRGHRNLSNLNTELQVLIYHDHILK